MPGKTEPAAPAAPPPSTTPAVTENITATKADTTAKIEDTTATKSSTASTAKKTIVTDASAATIAMSKRGEELMNKANALLTSAKFQQS